MPTTYITTSLTDTDLNIAFGDAVIVTRTGEVLNASISFPALRLLGNNQAFIQGTIGSTGVMAIGGDLGSGYSVTITSTGQVLSGGLGWEAIRLAYAGPSPQTNFLTNHGQIHSAGGAGAAVYGPNARVINTGTISARTDALFLDSDFGAVSNSGQLQAAGTALNLNIVTGATISNDGIMSGALQGVYFDGGGSSRLTNAGSITSGTAISLQFSDNNIISNTGTLHGSTFAVSAFASTGTTLSNSGEISGIISLGTGSARIDNSGTINGRIEMGLGGAGALVLQNSGTIVEQDVLLLGDGADRIVNTGTMLGNMLLRAGDDLYDGREGLWGSVADPGFVAISGQAGNDTLLGGRAGETLLGGFGNDLLEGNGGADALFGDADADTLLGGEGDDTLSGGAGADDLDGGAGIDLLDYGSSTAVNVNLTSGIGLGGDAEGDVISGFEMLAGGAGNDVLTGATGGETLMGRGGNDTLGGGAGNDRLHGGSGNDVLEGGAGADVLVGGEGNDLFVFAALTDSTAATTGRDRIRDFEQGAAGLPIDRLDLSAIDAIPGGADNAFTFIGAAAFTAAGQVRAVVQSGLRTLVEVETTGDNRADFAVLLNGPFTLSASDFIL